MSDDRVLAALARLETGQAVLQTGLKSVESRLTSLEAGQTALGSRLTSLEAATETRLTSVEAKLTSLEAKLTSVEAKLTSLEARLTSLEAGQAELQRRFTGLQSGLHELREETIGERPNSLRVVLMGRLDRMQDSLTNIRNDIAVNYGTSDAVRRANDNTRDELRSLTEQVSIMYRQMKTLEQKVRGITGDP